MHCTQDFLRLCLLLSCTVFASAFVAPGSQLPAARRSCEDRVKSTVLHMGLDMVTYLRVEWIAAALCTNQTPRDSDVCLQLGCEDGRAVTWIPRTVEKLITSTVELDGVLPVTVQRQLSQQEKVRNAALVEMVNQRVDDLKETPDESVDIVLSLCAVSRMVENGLDWKKSVQEAARVLKPGGRLLFVEPPEQNGESYLDYLANLQVSTTDAEGNEEMNPVFEPLGYDDVDLVLVPHVAGVVLKSEDAYSTEAERSAREKNEEKDRMADISLLAFERGIKKRKRKKKVSSEEAEA
jgi:ubiquinone/menaquinone biosynthesis C-methylase UbiE